MTMKLENLYKGTGVVISDGLLLLCLLTNIRVCRETNKENKMNKLIMKARSGVTLVELLVVILIVTILSVSMLPLLQPFVVESQYAAEAIPVIGNLRTKIGLYQYDKGQLPCLATDDKGVVGAPKVETWVAVDAGGSAVGDTDLSTVDLFKPASLDFSEAATPLSNTTPEIFNPEDFEATSVHKHFGSLADIDYQELKGKRSKPNHYQYLVMRNGSDYAYFVGCFGDGNGLKMGTGYAVCEIVANGHKYVGTWKRYKPVGVPEGGEDGKICFSQNTTLPANDTDKKHVIECYVPKATDWASMEVDDAQLSVIGDMMQYGWEF